MTIFHCTAQQCDSDGWSKADSLIYMIYEMMYMTAANGKYWIGWLYFDECCVRLDEERLSCSLLSEPGENPASWTLKCSGSVLTAPSSRALVGQSTGSPGGDVTSQVVYWHSVFLSTRMVKSVTSTTVTFQDLNMFGLLVNSGYLFPGMTWAKFLTLNI